MSRDHTLARSLVEASTEKQRTYTKRKEHGEGDTLDEYNVTEDGKEEIVINFVSKQTGNFIVYQLQRQIACFHMKLNNALYASTLATVHRHDYLRLRIRRKSGQRLSWLGSHAGSTLPTPASWVCQAFCSGLWET